MKMCHISAVPRPSSSSTPNVSRHRRSSSTGSASPAEVASRRHDKSCTFASACATILEISVGTWIRIVGRKRRMRSNSASGVDCSGNSTHDAPTENGNNRFEPVA